MVCFGGEQDGGGWGELKKVRPPQPEHRGVIGYSDAACAVPDGWADIASANSAALVEITMKASC